MQFNSINKLLTTLLTLYLSQHNLSRYYYVAFGFYYVVCGFRYVVCGFRYVVWWISLCCMVDFIMLYVKNGS